MNRTTLFWSCLGVATLGAVVLWRQQQAERGQLAQELAHAQDLNTRRQQAAEENRRLANALPDPAEMDALRATEGTLAAARAELASLQKPPPANVAHGHGTPAAERFGQKRVVPSAEWQNAGNATSKAALETLLWAAAGGDVEAFARNISLPEGKARQQAIALWQNLPANLRETYDTPERLLAFLTIKDVIIGTAEVLDAYEVEAPKPAAEVYLRLSVPDVKTRDTHLKFTKEGESWKLVVPESAIARYTNQLVGKPAG